MDDVSRKISVFFYDDGNEVCQVFGFVLFCSTVRSTSSHDENREVMRLLPSTKIMSIEVKKDLLFAGFPFTLHARLLCARFHTFARLLSLL